MDTLYIGVGAIFYLAFGVGAGLAIVDDCDENRGPGIAVVSIVWPLLIPVLFGYKLFRKLQHD